MIKAKEAACASDADARTLQSCWVNSPMLAPPPKGAARPRAAKFAVPTPVARRTRAARAAQASHSELSPAVLPAAGAADTACKPGAAKTGGGRKRRSSENDAANDGAAEADRSATRQRLAA